MQKLNFNAQKFYNAKAMCELELTKCGKYTFLCNYKYQCFASVSPSIKKWLTKLEKDDMIMQCHPSL